MSKKTDLLAETNRYAVQVIMNGKVVKAELPASELDRIDRDLMLEGIKDIIRDITGRKNVKSLAEGAYSYVGGLGRQWDGIEDAIEEYLEDNGISSCW